MVFEGFCLPAFCSRCFQNAFQIGQEAFNMTPRCASWVLLGASWPQDSSNLASSWRILAPLGFILAPLGAILVRISPTTCHQVAHETPKNAFQSPANLDFYDFGTHFVFLAAVTIQAAPEKQTSWFRYLFFWYLCHATHHQKKHKLKIVFWHFCNATGHQKSKFSKTVKNKFSNRSSTNTNHIAELWGPAVNREASSITHIR